MAEVEEHSSHPHLQVRLPWIRASLTCSVADARSPGCRTMPLAAASSKEFQTLTATQAACGERPRTSKLCPRPQRNSLAQDISANTRPGPGASTLGTGRPTGCWHSTVTLPVGCGNVPLVPRPHTGPGRAQSSGDFKTSFGLQAPLAARVAAVPEVPATLADE